MGRMYVSFGVSHFCVQFQNLLSFLIINIFLFLTKIFSPLKPPIFPIICQLIMHVRYRAQRQVSFRVAHSLIEEMQYSAYVPITQDNT